MKREFMYIRCEVVATDPRTAALANTLAEMADGQPRPDVVPAVHPSGISFRHVRLMADDKDDAYNKGWPLLGDPTTGATCNDYVIAL